MVSCFVGHKLLLVPDRRPACHEQKTHSGHCLKQAVAATNGPQMKPRAMNIGKCVCLPQKGCRLLSKIGGLKAASTLWLTALEERHILWTSHGLHTLSQAAQSQTFAPFSKPHPKFNTVNLLRGLRGNCPARVAASASRSREFIVVQMAQAELFWTLLDGGHPLEDLKEVDLAGFDWSSRSWDGRTLMVNYVQKALAQPHTKFEAALKTIEWLIHSGARIEQKCTGGESQMWLTQDKENTLVKLECKGHSAISYVKGWQQKLKGLPAWKAEFQFLPRILLCFARASHRMSNRPRVSIDEGIAELWEKSLAAKHSHDLTIETADGLVTAHAHFLKTASSVVTAMLDSPMKEGKTQRIEVKDTSSKAVSLFLEKLGGVTYSSLH
eukprot:s1389_g18.t1